MRGKEGREGGREEGGGRYAGRQGVGAGRGTGGEGEGGREGGMEGDGMEGVKELDEAIWERERGSDEPGRVGEDIAGMYGVGRGAGCFARPCHHLLGIKPALQVL